MNSHRDNPFTRPSQLSYYSTPGRVTPTSYNNNQSANGVSAWRAARAADNPFEKSRYDNVFNRKASPADNKSMSLDPKHYGTYFPLSKYENRLKLRQIDTEIWKRQKQQEQRYKLEHFGSQALRYSSYSTTHSSFNNYSNKPQSPKFQRSQFSKQNIQQPVASLRKQDSFSPNTQYMFSNYNYRQQKYKNPDSNTSIVNFNSPYKSPDYDRPRFQKQYSSRGDINNNSNKNIIKANQQRSSELNRKNTASFNSHHNEYFQGSFNKNTHNYNTANKNNQYQRNGKDYQNQYKNQYKSQSNNNKYKNDYNNNGYDLDAFEKEDERKADNKMYGSDYGDEYQTKNNKKVQKFDRDDFNERNAFQNSAGMYKKGSKMSYGSNFEKEKPNFYQSDYINQDQKGPLNPMKFSSSFDSDIQPFRDSRPSRFGRREQGPQSIQYEGKQYFKIDLVL